MYEQILVALDGSELAEQVLPHVEALAEKFGSNLMLLRAITPLGTIIAATTPPPMVGAPVITYPAVDPMELFNAELAEATEYLQKIAERLGARGLKVNIATPEGPAAEAILEHARTQGTDLIAMTTHGRTGLGRLLLGSVADEVLRNASCPVLIIRVRDEASRGAGAPADA